MRIGIMTLWDTKDNYGAVLQCYALQEYLRTIGHDPFLIRYKDTDSKINLKAITPGKVYRYIFRRIRFFFKPKTTDEPRYFEEFERKYMEQSEKSYFSFDDLKNDPSEADLYLAGSDQVWNFYNAPLRICKDRIHAFFLDFGPEHTMRASYAASWDEKYVSDEELEEIKPLINKLDYVSVREKSGLKLCFRCGVAHAEWVPDPTLLLTAEDYRKLYNREADHIRKIKKEFILVYIVLGRKNDFDIKTIYNFADSNGLDVIYVTENNTRDSFPKYYPAIPEWLYLVDHAKYVITNSFHGTVFSLIFHKQYAAIPLTGYAAATNARTESLCRMFHTDVRYIQNYDFSILNRAYETDYIPEENRFKKFLQSGGGGNYFNKGIYRSQSGR